MAAMPFSTQTTMSNITSVSINNRARFSLNELPDEEDCTEIVKDLDSQSFSTKSFIKLIKYRKEKNYLTIFLHGKCRNPTLNFRGRYYPVPLLNLAISVASIPRKTRAILFPKEKWTEIDMVNSHYCLLWYYLKRKTYIAEEDILLKFQILKELVFKREEIISSLEEDIKKAWGTDSPREIIKKELLINLYSFDIPQKWIFGHKIEEAREKLDIKTLKFLDRLKAEVKNAMKITKCESASHLSERLSNIESEMIYEILNRFNLFEKRCCYIYDSLLIKNDQVENIEEMADKITAFITNHYQLYNYSEKEFIVFKNKLI